MGLKERAAYDRFVTVASSDPGSQVCSLCERVVPGHLITLHHLTPKSRGGKAHHRTPLCKPCHKQLHATYSNKELARGLDSVEALRRDERLAEFLVWIR